ncbi:transposase (plasmid) [Arsenophonus nasoniae]|uniref:Transposase n=1 Tax=Arsenophonus nasoniae TaxID=638 RepID=A0ABY8NVF8_9GAMM|nr:transposase [Arsenophonus nasoniae]WGM08027.1 transposase [Arsenophonus nasoniae]WGM08039.1 transposase [Arsenophonus nasoniae]WGM12065.1 transposase [Arsenophonus nasoniae]WGM12858.1 transposase [Arsenophonus nasoniae]WGM12906.1 transposase [Arsenophonus nasoniae]
MHTYGRQLNQHPHVHVSVTRGVWIVNIVYGESCFSKKDVEEIWRGLLSDYCVTVMI